MHVNVAIRAVVAVAVCFVVAGCKTTHRAEKSGARLERTGDEIVIAGQLFHTGAPVVLWTDPGGFDAYRTERRFVPWERASFEDTYEEQGGKPGGIDSPARYGIRFAPRSASTQPSTARASRWQSRRLGTTTAAVIAERAATRPASTQPRRSGGERLTQEQFQQVRGGGWPLELLQEKVDQFVYHYDVAGTARQCFNILHDHRGLSVHFMLDVDGTIYQTLDVKERAYHATDSNDRSVGIEIANIGAYPPNDRQKTLDTWYRKDDKGKVRMVLPAWAKSEWIKTPNFVARPAREQRVEGQIQKRTYEQYDLTREQYDSLIKLTAALGTALPKIRMDYPRDANGNLITYALPDSDWEKFQGVMGHYHVQTNKQDPGPAFQWDKVINGARKRMGLKPLPEGDVINNPKQAVAAGK
jgi:N-acetyl-anhydromuramyl-L-alanine amidase AmpD